MSPVRRVLNVRSEPGRQWYEIHPSKGELIVSFWMFVVSCIAVVGILGYQHNSGQIVKLSKRNGQLAMQAKQLAQQIQAQRLKVFVDECKKQNTVNRRSIRKLGDVRNQEVKTSPRQVVQLFKAAGVGITNPAPIIAIEVASINSSYNSITGLINTLAPVHPDCQAYAQAQVSGHAAQGSGDGLPPTLPVIPTETQAQIFANGV